MFWKYRWTKLQFEDGSSFVGIVPAKTWKEALKRLKQSNTPLSE